jgi:hypothetical protein
VKSNERRLVRTAVRELLTVLTIVTVLGVGLCASMIWYGLRVEPNGHTAAEHFFWQGVGVAIVLVACFLAGMFWFWYKVRTPTE